MRSRTGLDPNPPRTNWVVVGLVLIATAIALIPVLLHLPPPAGQGAGIAFVYLPALLAAVACYQFDRTFSQKEKAEALFICVAFAFLSNYLHIWLVDLGPGLPASTLDWQIDLHKSVIDLRPEVLPHSYRFLPNSLVRLFEQVTGDFSSARDSYRNLFGVLLYALYRFARLFHGRNFRPVCDRRLAPESTDAPLARALLVSGSSYLQLIFQLALGDEKFHAARSGPYGLNSLSFSAGRTGACPSEDAVVRLRTSLVMEKGGGGLL